MALTDYSDLEKEIKDAFKKIGNMIAEGKIKKF
jgi:hypothetical protein